MGCVSKLFLSILTAICQLLKVACAVAIIVIVYVHLWKVSYTLNASSEPVDIQYSCLLGNKDGESLCNYAYAVCGLSLVVNMLLSILLCCTCDLCGLGNLLETVFLGLGLCWWLAASLVFSKYVADANNNEEDAFDSTIKRWRTSVTVISWVCFALFTFLFLVYFIKLMGKVCKCMTCCCDDDDDGHPKKEATAV